MPLVNMTDETVNLVARTEDGYRLHWTFSEPDEKGISAVEVTVDYNDRLNVAERGENFGSDS